ncbi:MAG: RluA family pseudouridine synthase [Patescibacteria group bacterium]
MPKTIKITKESQGPKAVGGAGERLDKFLTEYLKDGGTAESTSVLTRSQIKKLIKAGEILVNGKKATVHRFLKTNDIIVIPTPSTSLRAGSATKGSEVEESLRPTTKTEGSLHSPAGSVGMTRDIKILEENNNFLIIEKPAGLLVHPTAKNETDTLADWIIAKHPDLRKIGEDPSRPAIVHRLDKEVSGLMLIPKTQDAFDYFKSQFKQHHVIKKYATLVRGEISKDEGMINFPIGRSKSRRGLFAAISHKLGIEAKKAITTFRVEKRFKNYTLLEVQILTGRTHQIRVHLLAFGHPVVGDALYGIKIQGYKNIKTKLGRIFLHAKYLGFTDMNGNKREFESELPEELDNFIKGLVTGN